MQVLKILLSILIFVYVNRLRVQLKTSLNINSLSQNSFQFRVTEENVNIIAKCKGVRVNENDTINFILIHPPPECYAQSL